jgi:hypothetical protein
MVTADAPDEAGGSKQSKGGKARALALSREEKSEIAKNAAGTRWKWPQATHEGVLPIASIEIPCAVLSDGRRVLSQQGFLVAIGRARSAKGGQGAEGGHVDKVPAFVAAENLKPFVSSELMASTTPIVYRTITGSKAFGYAAEMLPLVCEVYLAARRDEKLLSSQAHIAKRAEILLSGLARVGIVALIDEATGYQYDRPRRDLEEQLEKFVSESLRKWVRTFPGDYFKHLCRLRGIDLRPDMKLPQYFGVLTNNLIYKRLAPGLVKRLKERRAERGSPSNKLHSSLSEDIGFREVLVHLGTVVGLMKLHKNYDEFVAQLDTIASVYPDTPGLFDDPKDWVAKAD